MLEDQWAHIDSVLRARSLDEVKTIMSAYTHSLGFEHHGYAMRRHQPIRAVGSDYLYFEDFSGDWSKTYLSLTTEQAEQTDGRILFSRMALPPVAWNTHGRTSYRPASDHVYQIARKSLFAASEYGLRAGITVPISLPGLRWSFATLTHRSLFEPREMMPAIASATYFVHCTQATIDRLLHLSSTAPRLSPRECEVLRWSAVGKTSWEISMILHIAEATVNYHFQSAARKLGVKGRRAACAQALSKGLITL